MDTIAETDTYGVFLKTSADNGGLRIHGLTDTGHIGLELKGTCVTAETGQGTGHNAIIILDASKRDGTGLQAAGSDAGLVAIKDNGTTRFLFDAEGSGHADVEWVAFSDSRLKSSIEDIPYGLAEVLQLQPKRYDRQLGGFDESGDVVLEDNKRKMVGFIAQDVKTIIPELVKDVDETHSFYSMDDGKLMAVLVKAVQELSAKLDNMDERLTNLEGV